MARIDQSRVKSGFDVEALMGERYLQVLFQTAFDAGLIPSEADFSGTSVLISMLGQSARLYEPTPDSNGFPRPEDSDAFQTTILFGNPLGANLKVCLMIGTDTIPAVPFDLFLQVDLSKEFEAGALTKVGMAVRVVDADTPVFQLLETLFDLTKADILAKLQEFVDRTIDVGGASKFKRVEDIAIKWHEGDAEHRSALGLYINVFMRNGDEEDQFLPPRGALDDALNFLPDDEDMAMASRPGMYKNMAKDVFSRTAVPTESGGFEHAFRKSLLNPNSTRLGDLNSVSVGQMPPAFGSPLPQNGMRITIKGEIIDPIELTNTDLTFTIDIRPTIDGDGLLVWDTDFDADVDAVFEFTTIWAAALLGILLGPGAALTFLGVVFAAELGVGIGISLYKEGRVSDKADAALADVIPDRLTIKTRRWDPFYATLHQVVTKPSQAEFNGAGFMMCGKAFVGRQLLPPDNTIIRDETRDAAGAINGLRYRIADFETVLQESVLLAPGTSRREFSPADPAEPDLWTLSLDAFGQRKDDPEGPLVITSIPYFQASVHIKGHQIDGILCISETEIKEIQDVLRAEARQRGLDRILALDLDEITQEVIADLSAGGATPTQEEIDAEVDTRVQKKLKRVMDKYRSPEPLSMAFSGTLQPHLRFDISPEELVMLKEKGVVLIDGAVKVIKGRRVSTHVRDKADLIPGPEGDEDNLLNRPQYKPTAAGPVFR